MDIRKTLLLFTLACIACLSYGDTIDSLEEENHSNLEKYKSTELYRAAYVGAPLFLEGLLMKGQNNQFRDIRQEYVPRFKNETDSYLQYSPYAVLLGLKLAGVKGRSSWGRMLVSHAISVGIVTTAIQGIKHSARVRRPDDTDNNSFPSGHTATVFLTATMLAKEYDNIWIKAGAYTVATTTGLMRVANNKHWLSDVVAGAGIGIASTELGYYLADLIYKDKGLNKKPQFSEDSYSSRFDKPSFIGLHVGVNMPMCKYDMGKDGEFHISTGAVVGFEGAYFFNPYIGVGGQFTIASNKVLAKENTESDYKFDCRIIGLGGYFSVPLSNMWKFGGKLVGENTYYKLLRVPGYDKMYSRTGWGIGTGLSMSVNISKCYGMRFFADYDITPPCTRQAGEYMHTLSFGATINVSI